MADLTVDQIARLGLVGCGGAGFPTHVKLQAPVETVIVNGAECEPLLHKDKELMRLHGQEMLEGLRIAMRLTGAQRGVVGIKHRYEDVIAGIRALIGDDGISVHELTDTYPAGDEFILTFDVTGAVIPPGGLPKDVGVLTQNVETLINLARARPVTRKCLTVGGAVREPVSLEVAIGTSLRVCIEAAGGATAADIAVLTGGVMMGRLATDLDAPVIKTTGAVLVFPADHPLIAKCHRTEDHTVRIGRSACDQCSFCTDLCPRWLLGHPIEPHRAMRALGFHEERAQLVLGASYCCECNLCSLIACPEDLDPRGACIRDKPTAREQGLQHPLHGRETRPHALYSHRRTPISRLIAKLGLRQFRNEGPMRAEPLIPDRVTIPLRQHIGAPAEPTVKRGERVGEGDLIAAIPEGSLGAPIHASISGQVAAITEEAITLNR
ncbi:SLBB domain-containing protein [Candidatus Sumerlaeota bacterium]|nr:SLBB domain-containing protein [Candidatus Sumerlaeota bacterium]